MQLREIIRDLEIEQSEGTLDKDIRQIDFDSRKTGKGSLFVAVKGTQIDGHAFIPHAIRSGAEVIICEQFPGSIEQNVSYIRVADSAKALGLVASGFFRRPSENLKLVGVTGTNGKSTTVTLLYQLFSALGYKCGMFSTIENRVGNRKVAATHTTPDGVTINALLADMVASGCDYAFMEVSSHAVDQKRIEGLVFAGAVFSNISHDHLDYHKTFKAYIKAKKAFFDQLPKGAFALTNIDDRRGEVMVQNTSAKIKRYSLRRPADFRARVVENSLYGIQMEIDNQDFHSRLIGSFNAYNLLAVYAAAVLLGQDKIEVLTALSRLPGVEGRFDYILDHRLGVTAIVDYAHTPDALEKVLETIHHLREGNGRIITVVGCGGDRDRKKRPVMAKVACRLSQQVILTSDNPRSEDPDAILADMAEGIPAEARRRVLSIADRRQAIRAAVQIAQKGDIILVAGKGHEKYQEILGVKHPFDDKKVLKAELSG